MMISGWLSLKNGEQSLYLDLPRRPCGRTGMFLQPPVQAVFLTQALHQALEATCLPGNSGQGPWSAAAPW